MSSSATAPRGVILWPETRALAPTRWYWFAMYAASALGTNLGDFWSDTLGLGLAVSFLSLAAISAALIVADRRSGHSTEVFFWIAIVILRAGATNVGDYLTEDLGVARPVSSLAVGAAALAAGYFTRGRGSPRIDANYWVAMALGGAFGTVAGDAASHAVGLGVATVALAALLALAIAARSAFASSALIGYWIVVLAERAAGTPAGDLLAETRGIGLGLPVAMAITGGLLIVALALRRRFEGAVGADSPTPAR